jgi:cell division protein FtsX
VFSKRAALEALRQQYPALASHLSGNPLPDSIDVRLTGGLDASRLIADLKAKRLPGIARVRYITQK